MERIDGERWSLIVDADSVKDADGRWIFYPVPPTSYPGEDHEVHLCCTVLREDNYVRVQAVELDEGKRPGHVLWRERAERRIDRLEDSQVIPWNLVRRA